MASKQIRDNQGKVKYTIDTTGEGENLRKDIRDSTGARLGFVKDGQTYKTDGKRVSMDEDFSALT